jgi:trigger factor
MKKHYSNITINKLPLSQVEIIGEISSDFLEEKFNLTLKKVASRAELPGFRKGHVPSHVVLQRVGEMSILEEAAEIALESEYLKIIEDQKLRVIGQPEVSIKKLARGNPLEFGMTVAVVPEVNLPDYKKLIKKISKDTDPITVEQAEIDAVLFEVREKATHKMLHDNGTFTDEKHPPLEEKDLEPLTDEFAKKLGDFADLEDLKKKVGENLQKEKEMKAKEKHRLSIIDTIVTETQIEVPAILIESELDKMMAQFEDDIARAGMSFDDYIKNIGKEKPQMREEWRETALKKAKVQLILTKIAEDEKIAPDTNDILNESEKILMVHKDADPLRVRVYVAMMMTNEKVLEFLEK